MTGACDRHTDRPTDRDDAKALTRPEAERSTRWFRLQRPTHGAPGKLKMSAGLHCSVCLQSSVADDTWSCEWSFQLLPVTHMPAHTLVVCICFKWSNLITAVHLLRRFPGFLFRDINVVSASAGLLMSCADTHASAADRSCTICVTYTDLLIVCLKKLDP